MTLDDMKKQAATMSKWYESGVLNPDVHGRLVEDIERIAFQSGVHPRFITTSMTPTCSLVEKEWVKSLRSHGDKGLAGLLYTSKADNSADRMMLLAGAFIRNFIDARVITIQDVMSGLKDNDLPNPTVMVIPNFCYGKYDGGDLASWQISSIVGLLMSRYTTGKSTVLFAQSIADVSSCYGRQITSLIQDHYTIVGA